MTAREINRIVRDGGNGLNVYIVDTDKRRFRVSAARMQRGVLYVRILATGSWVPVYAPEYVEASL